MKSPRVSVLMPVYNGQSYIRAAIESILNQSFRDFELVIVNDGSTDASCAIIKSYEDPRIKLFHNDKNEGLSYTRNLCIAYAQGEYLANLDCDDIAFPTRLEEQVSFLDANPAFGMIGSWIQLIDSLGEDVSVQKYPASPDEIPSILLFNNYFAQSSVMMRKPNLPEPAYRSEFPPAEDYDLWIRISQNSKVWNLQKILVKYRVHNQNTSCKPGFTLAAEKKILRWQLDKMNIIYTEEEFDIYFSICKRDFKSETCYLNALWKCTEKLKYANQFGRMYEEPYFSDSLKWIYSWIDESRQKLLKQHESEKRVSQYVGLVATLRSLRSACYRFFVHKMIQKFK